jgi:hypothetical protein
MTQWTDVNVLQRMTNILNGLHGDDFNGPLNQQLTEHMRFDGLTPKTVRACLQQAQKRSRELSRENQELTELSQDKAKQRERETTPGRGQR